MQNAKRAARLEGAALLHSGERLATKNAHEHATYCHAGAHRIKHGDACAVVGCNGSGRGCLELTSCSAHCDSRAKARS